MKFLPAVATFNVEEAPAEFVDIIVTCPFLFATEPEAFSLAERLTAGALMA